MEVTTRICSQGSRHNLYFYIEGELALILRNPAHNSGHTWIQKTWFDGRYIWQERITPDKIRLVKYPVKKKFICEQETRYLR